MAAVEMAEVLALDAMENSAPRVWSVLTTRTPTMDVGAFRRSREAVMRAVRRRWPSAQAATMVEFQTGRGANSGGERRPHWNDMWKGIGPEDVDELQDVLCGAWCQGTSSARGRRRVDAEPVGQYVGTIAEFGGLMRYLPLHFTKTDQAPPKGWRGHRFRTSRGYLAQPMEAARNQARDALRFKRELWKAHQTGLTGQAAEDAAHRAFYEANELAWELVRVQPVPTDFDADGQPCAWEDVTVSVRP